MFELRAIVLILLSDVRTTVNWYGPVWLKRKPPLAVGPVIKGLEPYVVHEATGFGEKRVNRLEVIEPAIFPVQFPVEFRV